MLPTALSTSSTAAFTRQVTPVGAVSRVAATDPTADDTDTSRRRPDPGADGVAATDPAATRTPATPGADNTKASTDERGLTEEEQRDVEALRARDREVRAHEQAHLAAAGQYARGGIRYTYERGPDQRNYAVGGEVSVDTSEVSGDPEATLRKAETLRRAALAPAEPSAQDRAVAAEAAQMAAQARMEIAAERQDAAAAPVDEDASAQVTNDSVSGRTRDDQRSALTCPACGGAHSAGAHDGMTAYAASGTPASQRIAAV